MTKRFVLNTRKGTIHRYPTREDCNLDAVPRRARRYFDRVGKAVRACPLGLLCGHCFPV